MFSVATDNPNMTDRKDTSLTGLAAEIGMQRPFGFPELEAVLNVIRTHSSLTSQATKIFKEHGISEPQYNVLRILRGHGTPVSVYQIAREMISPHPDMPRLVERLEVAELVTKTRCQNDRRVVWVNLTKQGKAILKKLDQPLGDLHRAQLGHMSEKELRQLSDLLFLARHPPND